MDPKDFKILVVDDEKIVRESLANWLLEDGYTIDKAVDAAEALKKMNETRWDIFFLDIKMPGMDGLELHRRIKKVDKDAITIIITAYASVDTAVRALKEGAFDYITKPFDPDQLSHLVRNAAKQRLLTRENIELRGSIEALIKPPEIIGVSKHLQEVKNSIDTVAPTNTTVMIRGESGTGKELVAKSIHAKSERRFAPLVTVNCGALSETLLESELFGHEKGAFTGALYRRKGKLEIANGGTLFLDEIGTINLKTQVDLLRSIEEKEFSRIGGNELIQSDFRIICATNTNLEESVKNMTFREDLYYRLQVYTIYLKPLRERPEDIPELANYFIRKYAKKMNKPIEGIETSALDFLMTHQWKGNVRELENAIESALVVTKGPRVLKSDFIIHKKIKAVEYNDSATLADVEKAHIFSVLEKQNWNISNTAKILGVDRVTVYKKMEKYGLQRPENP
jgi:DNA-binding NtrC family response regulator